jgi:hypothetical protein
VIKVEDFAKSLAFEVKKDIAERYFGFRKIIEEDSSAYQQEVIASALSLENEIGFDLLRIYALLQDDTLVRQFYDLTRLGDVLFLDSYISTSPTIRKRLFEHKKVRGFFKKPRFINMFFEVYQELANHVEKYRAGLATLIEEHDMIEEEIKIFYKKNDISGIMVFLRSLDGDATSSGTMAGGINAGNNISMENKMRLHAPESVEKLLPLLPAIPSLPSIKNELKQLIKQALTLQPTFDLNRL